MLSELYEIKHLVLDSLLTGSSVVCDPPVLDTDVDIVILVPKGTSELELLSVGYTPCSTYELDPTLSDNEGFRAYRKGKINLIVVTDPYQFDSWKLATEWATKLNLLNKDARVQFFHIVLTRLPFNV